VVLSPGLVNAAPILEVPLTLQQTAADADDSYARHKWKWISKNCDTVLLLIPA